MHGFAGLRLVGTNPAKGFEAEGIEECRHETGPAPLPFPTCVRDLPVGRHRAGDDALAALERVSFSLDALREALAKSEACDDDGPRAA